MGITGLNTATILSDHVYSSKMPNYLSTGYSIPPHADVSLLNLISVKILELCQ